ncbi:MAG: DUF2066 domain-containing protein [Gammaproteobacteria bacterium]|nr:DUF2066 domain-containing protein [Gammaproteobacteria bacterium]
MNQIFSKHLPLFLFITLFLSFTVNAVSVTDLHSASVIVSDQGDTERQRGLQRALAQVLVKLSGSRSVLVEAQVKQAINKPLRYLSQFGYSNDSGAQRLNVEFDETAVNDLLLNNNLPLWQAERPSVLLWLVVEKANKRQLIGANSHPHTQDAIEQSMQRRGIPYFLPLLDLDDRALVSVAEVWGGFRDVIRQASIRYSPEATVIGRLYQAAGGWRSHWSLLNEDGSTDIWDAEGNNEAAVLAAGIDALADRLGRRYASRIDNTRRAIVTLSVNNISGVEDYAKALAYLESLNFVDRVSVHEVRGANASFIVRYKGHLDDVRASIERGSVLRSSASTQFSFNDDTLSYSLVP